MDIDLRPVAASDLGFLLELYASTRAAELAATGWSQEQKSAFVRSQFELQQRHYHHYFAGAQFLIIELRQPGAGAGPIGRLDWEWRETQLRLIDISLVASYRGRGIGTALLRDLHAKAAGRSVPLVLSVDRLNPAQALYRRLGFRRLDTGQDSGSHMQMAWDPPGQA